MVPGEPRPIRMAERFGAGASAGDEARERGVARCLEDRKRGQEEDHRTTSSSVCPYAASNRARSSGVRPNGKRLKDRNFAKAE